MENKKKQLLDTMKALPMTMEDKCAFVDLISQNSGNGSSQEDEYLYFDLIDVDYNTSSEIVENCPNIIVEMDNKVLEISGSILLTLSNNIVNKIIAVKAKRYIPDVFVGSGNSLNYEKIDTINAMNMIGAKQITKEEYNSFITFTIDDFQEIPLG